MSEAGRKSEGESLTGRHWLTQSDAQLLAQCEVDVYRASGPGGQKRNKTSSAVRLRHRPTDLLVIAEESRSQHENKARALRRLRRAMALILRNHWREEAAVPEFYAAAIGRDPTLRVNPKHADYWLIVQYVLDVFDAGDAAVSDTAQRLGISTGQLVRFFKGEPKLWEQVNRMRQERGLSGLK